MTELYISTDIEADGPIPGPHSMLSLGSAAFTATGAMVATFSVNLKTLDGASGHPDTMKWWKTQPHAWKVCRRGTQPPETAMRDYCEWVEAFDTRPVFVGMPTGFDFTFAALDVKSFAMATLKRDFHETTRRTLPEEWLSARPHTHVALEDAVEQGELFCNMLAAARSD